MNNANLLALPYSVTTIVEKVHYYTGTTFSKKEGLYVTASMAEEFKIKAREQIFKLQINTEKVKNEINDKYCQISFDDSPAYNAKAYIQSYNRCIDYLVDPLRNILRPVWSVYWSESCTGIGTVCTWLLKADKDQGAKVFAKLNLNQDFDI